MRSFLHQSDLAHWLFTLFEHGHPAQDYKMGLDDVISITDLAHLVRNILTPNKPV